VPQMLVAHSFALGRPREIVLAGSRDDPAMLDMLASIRRRFLPNAIVMRGEQCSQPMLADHQEAATVYVCENFACNLPVSSAAALDELLE